jgi:TM2 domain-containing membrane protein YozV
MNTATKAALFSAILFPGWGQLYLKHYKRGFVFILPVLIGALTIVWMVIQAGTAIIKTTPLKKGTVEFNNIIQVAVDAFKMLDIFNLLFILLLLAVLWVLSIADAYQLGKKMTPPATTAGSQESSSRPV